MDLAQWRSQRTATITLPSGLGVQVQRVAILDLAAQGRIPMPLVGHVQALLDHAQTTGGVAVEVATFSDYAQIVDLIVQAAVTKPPLAAVGDEAHLGLDELPIEDKLAIFNWAQAGGAPLAAFPVQPGRDAAPARGRPRVPATPLAPVGD